ncbi:sodium:solute symporter family protein [candidate division KSB1 bacterium]|nr:sodium:solute symporter family protein [candidate division KSB1 bacterium]
MPYIYTIILYLVVLFSMGAYLTIRVKNQEDFMVAGRKLTAPILVGTLLATWIGSGDIFSVADLSYNHGYSSLIGSAGGWLGIIVVYFIAGRVRDFGQFTVPDILEARYNQYARLLATITTIVAYVTIVSYQFRGGGWVLNIISEGKISIGTAMIVVAFFVIAYTVLAGMISIAYMDIINGLLIIGGVFLAIPFLIENAGGMDTITANVTPREHPFLGNMSWIQAMGYFVPTLLLALGNGNMYQRFFSAKDSSEAKKSVIGWVIGVIILGVALQSLAVIGSSYFKDLSLNESGKIILLVAHRGVPLVIGCILIAAIVAIIISTANSFLLVPATNIMRDIYQRFINPELPDKKIVLYSRLSVIVLGIFAYSLIQFFPRILDAAYAAYTIYGAGITPALMATFFWKRATATAGAYSIFTGMIITIIWEIIRKIQGEFLFGIPAVYPALVCSILVLITISYAQPKPDPEKWKPFFKKNDLQK